MNLIFFLQNFGEIGWQIVSQTNPTQFYHCCRRLHAIVAAHLRGMRPALTSTKHTLMLRRNSKQQYFYQNSKVLLLYIFITIVQIYGYVSNTHP